MKQLVFNTDEDMIKLTNYGFNYTYGDDWFRNFDNISVSRGDNNEFVISCDYEPLSAEEVEEDLKQLLLLEYDLIKANLLIVKEVEE